MLKEPVLLVGILLLVLRLVITAPTVTDQPSSSDNSTDNADNATAKDATTSKPVIMGTSKPLNAPQAPPDAGDKGGDHVRLERDVAVVSNSSDSAENGTSSDALTTSKPVVFVTPKPLVPPQAPPDPGNKGGNDHMRRQRDVAAATATNSTGSAENDTSDEATNKPGVSVTSKPLNMPQAPPNPDNKGSDHMRQQRDVAAAAASNSTGSADSETTEEATTPKSSVIVTSKPLLTAPKAPPNPSNKGSDN